MDLVERVTVLRVSVGVLCEQTHCDALLQLVAKGSPAQPVAFEGGELAVLDEPGRGGAELAIELAPVSKCADAEGAPLLDIDLELAAR